jgi:[protein-PII] uridylyltransferase
MTPWKADSLWNLYIGTANYMSRSADTVEPHTPTPADHADIAAALGSGPEVREFLAGLPYRYLRTHSTDQIAEHVRMASQLQEESVQVALTTRRDVYELTVITRDRAALFSEITGALTAWGMDILKADAYSNAAGVVVDTFIFRDRYNNLSQNDSERTRFQQVVRSVVSGDTDLSAQIAGRIEAGKILPVKRTVATRISFDVASSSHSTVVEIIAQDRVGLLYRIAAAFATQDCNIEIALVDTEGPMAVDVFYVTKRGRKLSPAACKKIEEAMLSVV